MNKAITLIALLTIGSYVFAQSEDRIMDFAPEYFEDHFNDWGRDPCEAFSKDFEKVEVDAIEITDVETAEDDKVAGKRFKGILEVTSYYSRGQYSERTIKFMIDTRPSTEGGNELTDFFIWQKTISSWFPIYSPDDGPTFQF